MNALLLINSFFKHKLSHPISDSAQSLYFGLYHIQNSAGWPSGFKARNIDICGVGSCSSESKFFRARKELKDNGYITYEEVGGKGVGTYSLIALYENNFANDKAKNLNAGDIPAPVVEPQPDNENHDFSEQINIETSLPDSVIYETEGEVFNLDSHIDGLNGDETKSKRSLNGDETERNKDIYINKNIYKQEIDVNTTRICARNPRHEELLIKFCITKQFFINDDLVNYCYKDLSIYDKFTDCFLTQLESGRPLKIKDKIYSHSDLCKYAQSATSDDFYIIFDNLYLPRQKKEMPIIAKPITDYTKFIYSALINRIDWRKKKIYSCADGFIYEN